MTAVSRCGSASIRSIDRCPPMSSLSIWIDRSIPRFEGNIALRASGRPCFRRIERGTPVASCGSCRRQRSAADLDQIELQYGWEERAIKLRGSARLTFGSHPQVEGTLSAPQIDLDRAVALPEETRRRPVAAVKALAVALADAPRWPVPLKLGLKIEALTVAGGHAPARRRRIESGRRDLAYRQARVARARTHPGAAQWPIRCFVPDIGIQGAGQDRFWRSAGAAGVADRPRRPPDHRRRLVPPEW